MTDPPRPEYKVYRSRPSVLEKLRPKGGFRRPRPEGGSPQRRRPRLSIGRVVRWLVLAAVAWVLLSLVVFFVSAQLERRSDRPTERVLSGGSTLLGGSTILVLGSDRRPEGTQEPGASGASARADSILLLRVSFGRVRRLSVLRDSLVEIPGHGAQKINAAYAIGGAPLAIETVESFLGGAVPINHVVEVSFQDFPPFIDALGGIDVTLRRCISSAPFGGRRFRLTRGDHHLNGRQALAFARVRQNKCAPNEDDRARARRQQQVVGAVRSRLLSPLAFPRLPLIAWQAPKTLQTDMAGPGLLGLFVDVASGGAGRTRVLRPESLGPGGSLIVGEEERARAARYLVGGR